MGAYLSDRLFVALAKKVGFPDKPTLTTYRSLQLEFVRSGMPVTLFTLTKLKGVLDERQADQFIAWARQVAAARPTYTTDLRETGARRAVPDLPESDGVVEVRPNWMADETADVDSVEIDVAADALDPSKDHTEELMRLLDNMSVEEVASRSRRALGQVSASTSRFESNDLLPTLGGGDTVDPLEALVSGYVGGSHAVEVEVVESEPSLFGDSDIAPSPFVRKPQQESQVDDLLESHVDVLDPHHESHVDLFEDAHPSADDCLALFDDEPVAAAPPIEDMDTDVIEVDGDPLLDMLPEWEVDEPEAEMPADSALFDVLSWDEVSDQIDALDADANLDLDIVDPWADPPTTAAPELPRMAPTIAQPSLGPTNAKASAEFVGDPLNLLESESSFDPWGSSFDSVKEPSLYDQLKSDSGTRAGYQPVGAGAAPPPPPPLAPPPNHYAA